jgi:hypothetical protein
VAEGTREEGSPVDDFGVATSFFEDDSFFSTGVELSFSFGAGAGLDLAAGVGFASLGFVTVEYPPTGPSKVFEAVTYTTDTMVCTGLGLGFGLGLGSGVGSGFANGLGRPKASAAAEAIALGSGKAARAWRR